MPRTTKSEVISAFKALAKATGHPVVDYVGSAGSWRLDHAREYGGYQIQELLSAGEVADDVDFARAVRTPFGSRRRSAAEFYDVCWFAVEAIDLARRKESVNA